MTNVVFVDNMFLWNSMKTRHAHEMEQESKLKEMKRLEERRTRQGRAEQIALLEEEVKDYEKCDFNELSKMREIALLRLDEDIKEYEEKLAKLESSRNKDILHYLEWQTADQICFQIGLDELKDLRNTLCSLPTRDWIKEIQMRRKHLQRDLNLWVSNGCAHSSKPAANVVETQRYRAIAHIIGGYSGEYNAHTSAFRLFLYVFEFDSKRTQYLLDVH